MALTRAQVEAVLVRRLTKFLTQAGMAVTTDGTNADLNDPIGYAVRRMGGTVASIAAVADTDLAVISAADTDQLLDLAELRALQSIETHLVDVDVVTGPVRVSKSQLAAQIAKTIDRKATQIANDYGAGVTAEIGTLDLNLSSRDLDDHTTPLI